MDRKYIEDKDVVRLANEAIRIEIEKKKALNIPIVIYDSNTQKVYKQHSDGRREEIGGRLRGGRYSERVAE